MNNIKANKRRENVLDKNLIVASIIEGVHKANLSVKKTINPINEARKIIEENDSSIEANTIYKAVTRTFNELLDEGCLKIFQTDKAKENYEKYPEIYDPINRQKFLLKSSKSLKAYLQERNTCELYTFSSIRDLHRQIFSDLEQELFRIVEKEDEFIGLYFGKTLKDISNSWTPSKRLKEFAVNDDHKKREYAPFVPMIGDICLPSMPLKQFQDTYSTNSNELALEMNQKLYENIDNGKSKIILMNYPALLCQFNIKDFGYESHMGLIKSLKEKAFQSEAISKRVEYIKQNKIQSFFLSIGTDLKINESVYGLIYSLIKDSQLQLDANKETAELLGRYFYIDDNIKNECIGGDTDPDSLPSSLSGDNLFRFLYYMNMGIGINSTKKISENYLKKDTFDKGLGVCVIIGEKSKSKVGPLSYFLSIEADKDNPPFFNRVYMLDEYIQDLEDKIDNLTQDYKKWKEKRLNKIDK